MSKYTYVLKADQQTGGYNSSYRNMDIVVTVVAETWDLAQEEAKRILPPLKSSTSSWAFWSKSITPYEEPRPDLIQLGNEALRLLSRIVVKTETATPAQQAAVAIHDAPKTPWNFSDLDTQSFQDTYMDGPNWTEDRDEYWACCDVCDTDTYNAHENVTEDWMIDHANAHIGGTI